MPLHLEPAAFRQEQRDDTQSIHQITLPQPTWLREQAEGPFQRNSAAAKPARGA